MKKCSKCLEFKDIYYFAVRSSAKDGRRGECKSCINNRNRLRMTEEARISKNLRQVQARADNPQLRENKNRRNREYKKENKERIRLENRAYREANREKLREANRARYAKHREKILSYFAGRRKEKAEYDRQWVAQNKGKAAEQSAKWKRENRDRLKIQRARRAAMKLGAEGSHTTQDVAAILASQNHRCKYCQVCVRSGYHLDHRVPLSRGGSNWPDNLQILCGPCNVKKWAKMPEDFERQIGYMPANDH